MIELNKKYTLDLGSTIPVVVLTKEFTEDGVLCDYINSWSNREEIISNELFEINGYNRV